MTPRRSLTHGKARPSAAGLFCAMALGASALLSGCAEPEEFAATITDVRTFSTLSEFLGGYWTRPIPAQGATAGALTELDASLQPDSCGTCHVQQYADWQTTVHSEAYSPGLSGQLVTQEESNHGFVRSCLTCHAPLSEQQAKLPQADGRYLANPDYDPALRDHGMVCAACHARGGKRYGPPRRDGSTSPSAEGSPHGGVTRSAYFEDSRFCAGCHQFSGNLPAPNGKYLENTFAEWEASRYPAEGTSCQSCHMPDRRHLWRGIHDPEMTASGVTIEWIGPAAGQVGLRVTNTGTGHMFPTYVTPSVIVRVSLRDGDNNDIPGASREARIVRQVASQPGGWVEISDTRLAPDSSMTLTLPLPDGASSALGEVIVLPDDFYRNQFEGMLSRTMTDSARVLIGQAHERSVASPYHILNDTIPLGR
ncbi:MAG: multiheme c-type cytochrome [Gemmatimonadota bacterium]